MGVIYKVNYFSILNKDLEESVTMLKKLLFLLRESVNPKFSEKSLLLNNLSIHLILLKNHLL